MVQINLRYMQMDSKCLQIESKINPNRINMDPKCIQMNAKSNQMDQNGPRWIQIHLNGSNWIQKDLTQKPHSTHLATTQQPLINNIATVRVGFITVYRSHIQGIILRRDELIILSFPIKYPDNYQLRSLHVCMHVSRYCKVNKTV